LWVCRLLVLSGWMAYLLNSQLGVHVCVGVIRCWMGMPLAGPLLTCRLCSLTIVSSVTSDDTQDGTHRPTARQATSKGPIAGRRMY